MRQEYKYVLMKYIFPFIVLSVLTVFFLPIGAVFVDASGCPNLREPYCHPRFEV